MFKVLVLRRKGEVVRERGTERMKERERKGGRDR